MTARTIALSALMVELCSTCPLFAASPVRLSLTNATDYAIVVVVNTNLIKGIGMGAGCAYTTLRAEDITFLQEALTERLLLAPGTWMTLFGGRDESGMVPRELTVWRHWYDDWPDAIAKESAWPLSFSNEMFFAVNRAAETGRGFVPSSFALWTGGALSASTNAWLRNGYDAASDIRAVFSDDSRLFPTNELPSIPTFDGVPDFVTMTNAYALLDSPYVRTALYVEEPLKSRCAYTNIIDAVNNYDIVVSNQYTQYQIPGTGDYGRYMSGYTATNVTYSTTYFSRGSMDVLYWSAEHEIHLDTPWSVEYTSADRHGGKVHALAPYKETDRNSTTLPDSGTAWRLKVQLQRGWDGNGRLYNTNLVVRAYAVLALKCTSTTTGRRDYAIPEVPSSSTTSNLVRNVTVCLDLGELTMVGGAANVWEAATTPFDVAQTFRTAIAYAEIADAWDHRLFPQVPISNPVVCDPNDYPNTTASSLGGTGRGVSIHSHTMQCVKILFILLVSPTYHARVLGDY